MTDESGRKEECGQNRMDRGRTKVEGQRSVDKTGWIEDGQKWKDKGVRTKQDG